MIEVNKDEQKYAFLWDKESQQKNRYGDNIELTQEDNALRNISLNINGDLGIGENPNRYKQHGFYLNADNCIGCHACEAACSEKNDNPAHIAFRSVGYVEGGTYPDYQRINISMACNHCDDPVCLTGCPTRAYTKFVEYGAVLQDPDICFGCGYCTWVCPYNAPQLDPVKGEVTKCNMCVDRLEVGLKPSCVTACLGNALDFGVIENVPENREQSQAEIPGFPTTEITHPNIRFQQTKGSHHEMTRTDSMPVKYHREDTQKPFKPVVDEKSGRKKYWNFKSLLTSHESAHVIFTLFTQATVGAFLILILAPLIAPETFLLFQDVSVYPPILIIIFVISTVGLYKLNMHLGKPHRFYRGFNNLRLSPVSREIAGVSMFYTGLLGAMMASWFEHEIAQVLFYCFAALGCLSGVIGLYYMYKLYRIPARPFWDHKQTGTAFLGTTLSFGGLILLIACLSLIPWPVLATQQLIPVLFGIIGLGLMIEGLGHILHAHDMKAATNEGAASYYQQVTQYGKSYILRNILLALNLALVVTLTFTEITSILDPAFILIVVLVIAMLVMGLFGRSLFFVLVIPTTMPGAFSGKTRGLSTMLVKQDWLRCNRLEWSMRGITLLKWMNYGKPLKKTP